MPAPRWRIARCAAWRSSSRWARSRADGCSGELGRFCLGARRLIADPFPL